ncbi:MAG: CopG family transcriptional regulator [Chlorobium sp.]
MMNTSIKDAQMSFKTNKRIKERVEALAVATRRSKTFVLEEAVTAYLDYNEWQIKSIMEGIEDAKAGRVTPIEDVIAEWEGELENCPD